MSDTIEYKGSASPTSRKVGLMSPNAVIELIKHYNSTHNISGDTDFYLPNTGVIVGSYTNSDLTVDVKGRITSIGDGVDPTTSLSDLTDTLITSPSSNQMLKWNGSTAWVNVAPSSLGIVTNTGTPISNSIAVWDSSSVLRHDSSVSISSGVITASRFTGTEAILAPFTVASTFVVANLNASLLNGKADTYFSSTSHTHSNYITSNATDSVSAKTTWSAGGVGLNDTVPISFSTISTIKASGSHTYWDLISGDLYITDNGTNTFLFDDVGNFHSESNITGYSVSVSDRRLKTNIDYLSSKAALDCILNSDGVTYTHKYKDKKKIHGGYMADEIEKVIPHLITKSKILNAENWGFKKEEKFKTVNYTEVIPYITEAIKEQNKLIIKMKAEIKKLKS